MKCKEISEFISKSLRDFADGHKLIIGISGGIDSAVVAALAVKAIGAEKLVCIYLPTKNNTKEDRDCAQLVFEYIGKEFEELNIQKTCDIFIDNGFLYGSKMVVANIQARVRMTYLYALANATDGRVLGTGNKSELMIGYFTKFGDSACDIEPIGNLYKTDVFELARYLKLPREVIDRAPSAGLWKGQTDEEEIGMSYEMLDSMLKNLHKIHKATTEESKLVSKIFNATHKNFTPGRIYLEEEWL